MKHKILLIGVFGINNLGDDLMLEVATREFLKVDSNVELTLALIYGSIEHVHIDKRVKVLDLTKLRIFRRLIARYWLSLKYDALIWIGGSCFTDKADDEAYYYMTDFKDRFKKVGFVGVAISDLSDELKIYHYKHLLETVDLITFRDENSYKLAKYWTNNKNIHLTEDLTYLYSPSVSTYKEKAVSFDISSDVLVSWRSLEGYYSEEVEEAAIDELCQFLISNVDDYDKINIVTLGSRDDEGVNRYIYQRLLESIDKNKLKYVYGLNAAQKVQCIKNTKLAILGRLHGVLMSELNNIRTIAIGYDNKTMEFLKSINREEDIIYPDKLKRKWLETYIKQEHKEPVNFQEQKLLAEKNIILLDQLFES